MSTSKIEQEIQQIKQDFSEIAPRAAFKTGPVQEPVRQKGSRPGVIVAAVVVIVIAVVVFIFVVM